MAIVSYTWEEIQNLPKLPTDWERLKNIKDEDIDYSDNPAWTDEDFATATRYGKPLQPIEPEPQRISLSLLLNPNTLSTYRKMGKHWKSKLRANVEQYLNQQVAIL